MVSLRESLKFEVSSAKQERPGVRDCGLMIADWKTPVAGGRRRQNVQNEPNLARPPGEYAKRTQFGPTGEQMRKTNPIPPRRSG
jgi:hypothetical protein